jgi:phospholipid/cholesterol/gamma-HCH transport system ATP-binding protein
VSEETIIECRGLTCGYPRAPVLFDLDLAVRRGEILAVVGGSGSGKSTLLKTFGGLLPPLGGMLHVFGQELYALSADERRALLQRTGTVFQQDALFASLPILDNVAFPVRQLTGLAEPLVCEIARLKLALVELAEYADRMPADLSGGQRRRVAVARGSALDPDILFCDEPTTGLDPILAAHIEQTLLRLRELTGTSVVLVTHELATVRAVADRVIMVGRGRILASGTASELEQRQDPEVHAFFHREASRSSRPALLDELEGRGG